MVLQIPHDCWCPKLLHLSDPIIKSTHRAGRRKTIYGQKCFPAYQNNVYEILLRSQAIVSISIASATLICKQLKKRGDKQLISSEDSTWTNTEVASLKKKRMDIEQASRAWATELQTTLWCEISPFLLGTASKYYLTWILRIQNLLLVFNLFKINVDRSYGRQSQWFWKCKATESSETF